MLFYNCEFVVTESETMAKNEKMLYMRVRNMILNDLKGKPYYTLLPGERELSDRYHVSRPTVRKALTLLEEEGSIIRIQGRGAFFTGSSTEKDQNDSHGSDIAFYNQVKLRGDYTSSKVLTQKVEIVDGKIGAIMNIPKGSKVFHLERLRYINGVLWTLADSYTIYELCPELMDLDFTNQSLHNTLSSYGHAPCWARRHITAKKSDEYEAFNLGLNPGDPVCVTETLTYDNTDQLMEYSISRGSIYHIAFDLTTYNEPQASVNAGSEELPGTDDTSPQKKDKDRNMEIDALLC